MSDRRHYLRAPTFEEEVQRHDGLLRRWAMPLVAGRPSVSVEELMNVGRIAMWEKWHDWSEAHDARFLTYVTKTVKRRMRWEACRLAETIRVPRQANYDDWCRLRIVTTSLDEPRRGSDGQPTGETVMSSVAAENADPLAELERANEVERLIRMVALLPERQRTAVRLCFLEGMTQAEAGVVMGVSHQRVAQLAGDGLVNLRRGLLGVRELTYNQKRKDKLSVQRRSRYKPVENDQRLKINRKKREEAQAA